MPVKGTKKVHGSEIRETGTGSSRCTHSGMKNRSDKRGVKGRIILTPSTKLAYNGETYKIVSQGTQPENKQTSEEHVLNAQHDASDRHQAHVAGLLIASDVRHLQEDGDITRRKEGNGS